MLGAVLRRVERFLEIETADPRDEDLRRCFDDVMTDRMIPEGIARRIGAQGGVTIDGFIKAVNACSLESVTSDVIDAVLEVMFVAGSTAEEELRALNTASGVDYDDLVCPFVCALMGYIFHQIDARFDLRRSGRQVFRGRWDTDGKSSLMMRDKWITSPDAVVRLAHCATFKAWWTVQNGQ